MATRQSTPDTIHSPTSRMERRRDCPRVTALPLSRTANAGSLWITLHQPCRRIRNSHASTNAIARDRQQISVRLAMHWAAGLAIISEIGFATGTDMLFRCLSEYFHLMHVL